MLEERLARAAADGELDAPTLSGRPLPDLDHVRPQGWWADRFVGRELSHDRRQRAAEQAAIARAGFWRASSLVALRELVVAANEAIVTANRHLIESDQLAVFDVDDVEDRWRRLQR